MIYIGKGKSGFGEEVEKQGLLSKRFGNSGAGLTGGQTMIMGHIRSIKQKDTYLSRIFLLILLLLNLGYSSASAMPSERTDKLIEGAKKEGKLLLYSSVTMTDVVGMAQKFGAKYPFIKVEYVRIGAQSLLNRILNEARAKSFLPDVIQLGTFELYPIKQHGLLAKYMSPERDAYSVNFKDAEGYYTVFNITTKPIAYNTKLVPPDKVPKSYGDLLAPQWKGKIAIAGAGGSGAGGIRWFMCVMKSMGDKKGEEFMRTLAKQKPIFNSSTSLVTTLLAAAEFPLAVNSSGADIEGMMAKGAKLNWIKTDPMFLTHTGISLPSNASHPNSAKLFIDFVLSKEGAEIIRSYHRIPARSDVEPDPPRLVKGLNLFPYKPEWAEEYDEYAKKFQEIFK
jgi:iron(III) transport system substrate-binding protein